MIPTYCYEPALYEPYEIKGRGWAYAVRTTCECTRDDLCNLVGTEFMGQKILGVESFCVENQSFKTISLLVANKIEMPP